MAEKDGQSATTSSDVVRPGSSDAPHGSTGQEQVRSLGQPLDTISGATREMFEVRSGNDNTSSNTSSIVFKVVAVLAIAGTVVATVVTQLGAA